jgi:hypothetical protein
MWAGRWAGSATSPAEPGGSVDAIEWRSRPGITRQFQRTATLRRVAGPPFRPSAASRYRGPSGRAHERPWRRGGIHDPRLDRPPGVAASRAGRPATWQESTCVEMHGPCLPGQVARDGSRPIEAASRPAIGQPDSGGGLAQEAGAGPRHPRRERRRPVPPRCRRDAVKSEPAGAQCPGREPMSAAALVGVGRAGVRPVPATIRFRIQALSKDLVSPYIQ